MSSSPAWRLISVLFIYNWTKMTPIWIYFVRNPVYFLNFMLCPSHSFQISAGFLYCCASLPGKEPLGPRTLCQLDCTHATTLTERNGKLTILTRDRKWKQSCFIVVFWLYHPPHKLLFLYICVSWHIWIHVITEQPELGAQRRVKSRVCLTSLIE